MKSRPINITVTSEAPSTRIQSQSRFSLTTRPLNIWTPSNACCASDAAVPAGARHL